MGWLAVVVSTVGAAISVFALISSLLDRYRGGK